jgi:DNA-binding NtrC family response regulator
MDGVNILIVDDEESVRAGLAYALRGTGYRLRSADSGETALALLREEPADIVLSDHRMPGMSGLELLEVVRNRYPDTVCIMLTGHADLEMAVEAINGGEIYRFLQKPCDRTALRVTLHLALEKRELELENRRLLALVRTSPELVERLEAMRRERARQRLT